MLVGRLVVALLGLMLCSGLAEAQAGDPAGRWALRAGDQTLILLELRRAGADNWEGTLTRPSRVQMPAGAVPSLVVDDTALRTYSVRGVGRGAELSLVVTGADGGADRWKFTVAGERAGFALDGPMASQMAPLPFVRAGGRERVATGLRAGSRYSLPADLPTNPEMTAIFAADQADRQSALGEIDWAAVQPRDATRKAQTRALLDAGALRSGDDYFHAAFIFQHGGRTEDYLLAHTLAVVAAARGRATPPGSRRRLSTATC